MLAATLRVDLFTAQLPGNGLSICFRITDHAPGYTNLLKFFGVDTARVKYNTQRNFTESSFNHVIVNS